MRMVKISQSRKSRNYLYYSYLNNNCIGVSRWDHYGRSVYFIKPFSYWGINEDG